MGAAALQRLRFAQALGSRPFALLWTGQTLSALGNGAFATALAWEVLLLTGSAAAMGFVVAAQSIPKIVFLLLGGVTADRLPRRFIMFWSDAGRAIAVLFIAQLGWSHLLSLGALIGLALFFGCVSGFFGPAYQAIVPDLVEKDALSSANALNGLSQQLNQLLGPLLGVGLVLLAGPVAAFAFDGLTFIVSAVCLLLLRPLKGLSIDSTSEGATKEEQDKLPTSRAHRRTPAVVRDIQEGLSYITRSTWLWVSILVAAVSNLGVAGPLVVALPRLVHDVYGAGVWLLGALSIANAFGAIIATFLVGQFSRIRHRGLIAYFAMCSTGFAIAVFGVSLPRGIEPFVVITAGALAGAGLGAFDVIWTTVMQELVPREKLGRVSSIDLLGSFCLFPVGYTLTGLIADSFGPSLAFMCGGLLTLLMGGLAMTVRDIRQME